ncbi:HAMP domain-containing histidine kinase [Lusitaniella coriacea LEGE 07157]|uniref:HAMP domain-containing histidine kinase n=1 Tax=Lusitaniella coriacea LEGE 07157 TaxID=945747 RepID=A0A8J7DYA8_9CYAN|nr:HAMP domain-containing sensor histidine kinase [Lusitaniella coriacea]MBE9117350.1 HAMP domain-containing histidine kinase [Lusitaniella coriacea LEGE 07157]
MKPFSVEPQPHLPQYRNYDLSIESTLLELSLHDFQLDITAPVNHLTQAFTKYPLLPGAILTEDRQFFGAISRRQILEYLLLPEGLQLFLEKPLQRLYSYARPDLFILPGNTPILTAARRVLRRSPQLLWDPIIVKIDPSTYQLLDFGQLNLAAWQIRGIETQVRYERTQAQMIQSEKMASLGRLVDGLAHEILDPVGFIWGNLTHITNYSETLLELLSAYEDRLSDLPEELLTLKEELDSDYLQDDFPRAVDSITVGAKRLKQLVTSLQNFCHVDSVYPKPADLHACLDGILLLLKSRLTSEIKVVKNYGSLPPVTCYLSSLTQVFMNIITNAVDVLLDDAVSQDFLDPQIQDTQPTITITTAIESRQIAKTATLTRWVSIRIADNGSGMSEKLQQKIRESFTVEKRAAKETSLAVSYQAIAAKHGGELKLKSKLGVGTEFEILLPLIE